MHINPAPAPEQPETMHAMMVLDAALGGEEFIAQTAQIAGVLLPVCVGRHPPSQVQ